MISGLKNYGVPILVSAYLIWLFNDLEAEKSPNLHKFGFVKNMLWGFMSLCIIFLRCNTYIAKIICILYKIIFVNSILIFSF